MTYVKFSQPAAKTVDSFLNNILNELPSSEWYRDHHSVNFPPVNISETKDLYELEFNVPGRKKEDFKITVDKNILTVSFDKKEEVKDENKKEIKREFSLLSFKRSFTLDEKIASENIAAKYENGLLTVSLPKKEEVKVETKQISVN
ncbi:MAG: Hsp20/alpha crystallin family protein [Ginsengibacter sp.]